MDKYDLAKALFSGGQQAQAPGSATALYGRAAGDSANGRVDVSLNGVTYAAEGAGPSISMDTTTDVRAGETVIVTVVDGHPVVTGVVGNGDRLRTDVGAAASAASSAQESADSAKASADAATESATTLSRTRMLMATCDTDAATAAKAATLASGSLELRAGASVTVVFSHANTASAPTLDVGGTGARPLRTNGSASAYWADGQAVVLTYDGTYWQVCSTPVYASTVTVGNPGGSNVRIDSNSVDVRDGTDVLSSFGKDKIRLGGTSSASLDMLDGSLLVDVAKVHPPIAGGSQYTINQVRFTSPSAVEVANSSILQIAGRSTDGEVGSGLQMMFMTSGENGSLLTDTYLDGPLNVSGKVYAASAALSAPLPVSSGGTGATSIDAARRNLHISQGSKVCHGHGTPWVTLFESWSEFQQATGCYDSGLPTLVTMNGDWSAFDGSLSGCEIKGGDAVYVMAQTQYGIPNISSTQSLRINWICIW